MTTAASGDDRHISEEIERRRVLFEQTWGQPSAPSIEHLFNEVPQTERPNLLRELLYVEFEFSQRKNAGLLLEPYLARFPENESIVREVADAVGQYTTFKRRNIAGYTLLDELGRGGMGVVYRAKSDLLNNLVAFKMVNRRMIAHPEALQRFTRELEMIGRLRHPNIVEAKHAGIDADGLPFLIMELLDGITLNQWSKQHPPENGQESSRVTKACTIIRDATLGLQAIHEAGLVHRDIKPGNIMVLPNGQVKILDLGLAKLREHIAENALEHEPQTQHGHLLGTPGYMAPEQTLSAAKVDIRADIYSLGCTLFFLLYGRAPSENQPNELPVPLPQKLKVILDKMLATDPTARFQEPSEVAFALDVFLCSQKNNRVVKPVSVVAIFVCIAFAILALYGGGKNEVAPLSLKGTALLPNENGEPEQQPPEPPGGNGAQEPPDFTHFRVRMNAAIDLRYQGDGERAEVDLRRLEGDLRNNSFDGSDELLAEVLVAQGDYLFFTGFASDSLSVGDVRRLEDLYDKALAQMPESSADFRTTLLCKLAVVRGNAHLIPDEANPSLYVRFARAVTATDEQSLRNFIERSERLRRFEEVDLRLFALEHLISRNVENDREKLLKDLRLLDTILFDSAYPTLYLKRFFDLAIRSCDPTDYHQLVKYVEHSRLLPHERSHETARNEMGGGSMVSIYFSTCLLKNKNGFAIYIPHADAERQDARRFELPFNRRTIEEAKDSGKSLKLDAELVSHIQKDIASGIQIALSWDETAGGTLYHNRAIDNDAWPFGDCIRIDDILNTRGTMQ